MVVNDQRTRQRAEVRSCMSSLLLEAAAARLRVPENAEALRIDRRSVSIRIRHDGSYSVSFSRQAAPLDSDSTDAVRAVGHRHRNEMPSVYTVGIARIVNCLNPLISTGAAAVPHGPAVEGIFAGGAWA